MGIKYDVLLRKNANNRDKRRGKKGGKEEIFAVLGGKIYHFGKGGGVKITIIWIIYIPD